MKKPLAKRYQPSPTRVRKGQDPDPVLEMDQAAVWGRAVRVPEFKSEAEWKAFGLELQLASYSLLWAVGVWWNAGEKFERAKIVKAPGWRGPSLKTCQNAGYVVRKSTRRRVDLTFSHHEAVAGLPAKEAEALLDVAQRSAREGHAPTAKGLRQIAKVYHREKNDEGIAKATERAALRMGGTLFNVILADPPWRFETWSDAGKGRSPDQHYDTMTVDEICALGMTVPAAPDCVLFLWRTRDMMKAAIQVAEAWGFTVKSEFCWIKPKLGLGYYNRGKHEILMIATRGNMRAPQTDARFPSAFEAPSGKHSEKPDVVYEMIEKMYPDPRRPLHWDHLPEYYLEMFARRARHGWARWGREAPTEAAA